MNALFAGLISLPGSQCDVDKFRCLRLRETGRKSYALAFFWCNHALTIPKTYDEKATGFYG